MSNSDIKATDLLYLFYRVGEPIYYPKGEIQSTCYFQLSLAYLPERIQQQGKAPTVLARFNNNVTARRIDIGSKLNNALLSISLTQAQTVGRRDDFSLFIPMHQEAADHLINIFMGLRNITEVLAFGAYARERVNPQLFVYALSTALLHREDTKDLKIAPYSEVFPEKFYGSELVAVAKESSRILVNLNDRVPIEVSRDYTGNDSDPEHRLAYFREDVSINLHHWHWHLVYPFQGPDIAVRKNRRGEFFYYMHRQIIARWL